MGNSGNAKVTLDKSIMLAPGKNKIDLLSVTVGLQVVPVYRPTVWFIYFFLFSRIGKIGPLDHSYNLYIA